MKLNKDRDEIDELIDYFESERQESTQYLYLSLSYHEPLGSSRELSLKSIPPSKKHKKLTIRSGLKRKNDSLSLIVAIAAKVSGAFVPCSLIANEAVGICGEVDEGHRGKTTES